VADTVSTRRIQALLEPRFELGWSGASPEDLLDATLVPLDVAILVGDLDLLGRGGPVFLLRNVRPELPIVLLAKSDGRSTVRKALCAGVQGFVSYANLETGLEPTIDAVLAGQISVPQSIRNHVTWGTFSLREKQVLRLVADGLTNGEIACRLFLSESTIKCHLSSSFRKLGVSSRAEAAAAVLDPDHGLSPVGMHQVSSLIELEHQLLGSAAA